MEMRRRMEVRVYDRVLTVQGCYGAARPVVEIHGQEDEPPEFE